MAKPFLDKWLCLGAFDLLDAGVADVFALVHGQVLALAAEDAGILMLGEDDLFTVNKDLKRILLGDVKGPAQFDWDDDPSELVNLPHDAG